MSEHRASPLVELTRVRLLEFLREPEAVFWVFVFPVLLAVALGVAFRSQPASAVRVAVTGRDSRTLEGYLAGTPGLLVRSLPPAEAERALVGGELDVVVSSVAPR